MTRGGAVAGVLVAALASGAARAQTVPADEPFNYGDVRLGVLVHDIQFPSGREQSVDLNIEGTTRSVVPSDWTGGLPPWAQFLVHPRLHLGLEPNLAGRTSQAYAGITWTALLGRDLLRLRDGVEASFLFGPEINNGEHQARTTGRESLGSNVLFHLGADLSYRVSAHWLASLYYEHASNAGFARSNDGLNEVGLRIGYRF